jgi:MFS family permease
VYQTENFRAALKTRGGAARSWRAWPRVSRTVLLLGLTSLFTDISSEMVATILPLYVVFGLGLTPLQFGIVDGLYQGASALVRIASGFVADRRRQYKEVATAGYALSAACKLGLLVAGGTWGALAGVILVDRTGKGIRTAPRDALISLSSPRDALGTAFGVHRALDTAGAMVGPLLAFGLLTVLPGAYDALFIVSFCLAVIGVGVIGLFVGNHPEGHASAPADRAVALRDAAGLLSVPPFRRLVLAGTALGLATLSDGFLYLGLQHRLRFSIGYLPLLYVATALVFMALAVPVGRLADRAGRTRVFVGGYGLLLLGYSSLLLPTIGPLAVAGYIVLFGAYYAATDGVLMALTSATVPAAVRTSGLAVITTATSLARLLAAIAFGALWTWRGMEAAVLAFSVALAAALALAALALRGARG